MADGSVLDVLRGGLALGRGIHVASFVESVVVGHPSCTDQLRMSYR